MKEVPIAKRDEVDDFIASIEDTEGTAVEGGDLILQVEDVVESSSAAGASTAEESSTAASGAEESSVASGAEESTTGAPEATVTTESEVIITVTSCSNDICVGTTVPGAETTVTTTVSGTTTIYTTYCPVSSVETVESTKIITVTSCSDNKCEETTVEATPLTTETVTEGTVTEYVTYCPLSSGAEEESTKIITVTSCSNDICVATTVPGVKTTVSTAAPNGETTVYTTYCPESSVETVESTKIITVTSCSEDKCEETTVEATPSTAETVVEGTTTEYVTYCPVTSGAEGKTESGEVVVTATACDNDVCHETVVPGTKTTVTTTAPGGETTVYTTYGPASSIETVESSKDITVWACDEQTCHAGTVGATPSTTETVYEGTTSTYVTYCPTTSVLTGGETIVTGAITSSSEIY
ncbi:Yeast-form wall Protein 1, partial [Candida tropicalis]